MELPSPSPVLSDNIPEELRNLDQWICWKWHWIADKERFTKRPINPRTGSLASTTNATTWSDHDTALSAIDRFGLSGIGFVFTDEDPYIGIDADKAISEDGVIDAVPTLVLRGISTYTERSPSGRGYHAIIRGRLPEQLTADGKAGKKQGRFEVYASGRYFTVTGDRIDQYPVRIKERTDELGALWGIMFPVAVDSEPRGADRGGRESIHGEVLEGSRNRNEAGSLSDEDIVRIARASRSGDKFDRLFDRGDTSQYGDDDSAADLALCNMLCFYTPDDSQVIRVFSASALGRRGKWQREDYRGRTLERARRDQRSSYTGRREVHAGADTGRASGNDRVTGVTSGPETGPRLILQRFDEVEEKEIDWLWPGWLAKGKIHILGGHPGDGKSTITTAIAAALSNGGFMPDNITPAPSMSTLILAAEDNAEDTMKPRLRLHNADMKRIYHIPAVEEGDRKRTVSIIKHLDLIHDVIKSEKIGFLVIDPITNYMTGSDRNSEGDVRDALMPINELAQDTGICVLCVMHVGKPSGGNRSALQSLLGSTAFGGVARNVWMVSGMPENEFDDEVFEDDRKLLGVVKSNTSQKPKPIEWSRPLDGSIQWHGVSQFNIEDAVTHATSQLDRAMLFLHTRLKNGEERVTELLQEEAKEYKISVSTIRRALKKMGVTPRKGYGEDKRWFVSIPKTTTNHTFLSTLVTMDSGHLGKVTNLSINQGGQDDPIRVDSSDFEFEFAEDTDE